MKHEREQDRDHIVELLSHGHSITEVAQETGLNVDYINELLNEHHRDHTSHES